MSAELGAERRWPVVVFVASLLHTAAFAYVYPHQRFDPDLMAYLVYFRNWWTGDTTLHGIDYFTHPKALLVFGLGPLGEPTLALGVTALVSAGLATLVYLIARAQFGRTTALLISAALLLDPSKAMLTIRSSADLYVAFFLFAAIYLVGRERLIGAACCLFLAALVKPVTLPCAAVFLTLERGGHRRWIAAALPALAIPLIALANYLLLGSVHGTDRFFEAFAQIRTGDAIGPEGVMHFALWTQLVKNRFVATAAFGFVGFVLWLGGDHRRLTSPLFLMPLLFLVGYYLLGFTSHFLPFFRFFWLLEVWFLMFVVYGAVETARRVAAGHAWIERAVVAIVLVLLADNFIGRQMDHQRDFARPFEQSLIFADAAEQVLRERWSLEQQLMIPEGLLPQTLWDFPGERRAHHVQTLERAALRGDRVQPDWILFVPRMHLNDASRGWVEQLIRDGAYEVRETNGEDALLARPGIGTPAEGPSDRIAACPSAAADGGRAR